MSGNIIADVCIEVQSNIYQTTTATSIYFKVMALHFIAGHHATTVSINLQCIKLKYKLSQATHRFSVGIRSRKIWGISSRINTKSAADQRCKTISSANLLSENVFDVTSHFRYGTYFFSKPILMICDPELAQRIMIKDFHYFVDRQSKGKKTFWN